MPNLNKLRGGKVGQAPSAQYGLSQAKYHNSESRLQNPQTRLAGDTAVIWHPTSPLFPLQHRVTGRRQGAERELSGLRAAPGWWGPEQCPVSARRERENWVASPGLRDYRDQHRGCSNQDPTWGQLTLLVKGDKTDGKNISDQGWQCGEGQDWAGCPARGLTTRTGWRTATDPPPAVTPPVDLKQCRRQSSHIIRHSVFDHSDQKTISESWLSTISFPCGNSLTISLTKIWIKTTLKAVISDLTYRI